MQLTRKIFTGKIYSCILVAGLFTLLSTITSCNKTPVASFEMNKTQFAPGETIELTNNSKNAKTYAWLFPDGQTSTAKDVNYVLHTKTIGGTYVIQLQAFSGKEKKVSKMTRDFTVQ